MQSRPDAFTSIGGDTIQMTKTSEYLRKKGVEVDISLELNPDLGDYDIIHLLNITRVKFTYAQLNNAKKHKKRVVLSPIYWNTRQALSSYVFGSLRGWDSFRLLRDLGVNYLKSIYRNGRFALNEFGEIISNRNQAAIVLSSVDWLLPNSRSELDMIRQDFDFVLKNKDMNFTIVPNGVDPEIFGLSRSKDFIDEHKLKDFVLCVGRFGFRKNQLSLIKALKGSGIKVVFIGDAPASSTFYWMKDAADRLYYRKCKQEADPFFVFLPSMAHNKLAAAYSACKVFALPSFYETPGLVALEAAIAGANICITQEGSTREYFLDFANYCDPNNLSSIRDAVLHAYNAPKSNRLRQHILSNFTWEHVAQATLKAYEGVMNN